MVFYEDETSHKSGDLRKEITYKGGGAIVGGSVAAGAVSLIPVVGQILAVPAFLTGFYYGWKGGKRVYEHMK